MRLIRRLLFLAVIVGAVAALLRRFGLLGRGECTPACACSEGQTDCTCGHSTCLSPATA